MSTVRDAGPRGAAGPEDTAECWVRVMRADQGPGDMDGEEVAGQVGEAQTEGPISA